MDANSRRGDATVEVRLNVARIEELLKAKGIDGTQARAKFFGLHKATYIRQINGEILPSLPVAVRMARRLEVDLGELVA